MTNPLRDLCSEVGCWLGNLPVGCVLCIKGLKSVVFTTGLCSERCFYCPISTERRGKDVFLINEVEVRNLNDLINEVSKCGSFGVGITGGDPLIKLDRTLKVIKLLKEVFGSRFHIHLYTTGILINDDALNKLVNAGLDELRIHVTGSHSWRAIRIALNYPIDVGIENPVIPNRGSFLKELIIRAHELGIKFVNLNELEVSESNINELLVRGIEPNEDGLTAKGSEELALKILSWVREKGLGISVHYCPARFKDRYQLRLRLIRRAVSTKEPYEEVGEDGLVRWVVIRECPNEILKELIKFGKVFKVGNDLVTNPLLPELKYCKYELIEAYPLTPRKVINIVPHNESSHH